jgi:hypothetical protein
VFGGVLLKIKTKKIFVPPCIGGKINIKTMKKLFNISCLIFALLVTFQAYSQVPTKVWDKTFGGSGSQTGNSIAATNDGGYVMAGYSASDIFGDKSENSKGLFDFWVVKINSAGQKVWDKTIGGSSSDFAVSIIATTDGGFIVAGTSQSGISGDKTEASRDNDDYWIVKLNSAGQKVWDKTLGGSFIDIPVAIINTIDNTGYVVVGYSSSGSTGDKTEAGKGNYDYWAVKLNNSGQKVWDKTIGGNSDDSPFSITTSSDGGFVIAGHSTTYINGDKTETNKGDYDFWVVKLNSTGQKVWDKTIGGNDVDSNPSISNSSDGGFVVAGRSLSGMSGDKTEVNRGGFDYWIVKLNSLGQKIWDKTIGGNMADFGYSIVPAYDGGFVVAGFSYSGISGDKTEASNGGSDYWLIKINSLGQKIWDKAFGGSSNDLLSSIALINGSEYVLAGTSLSPISGDKTQANKGTSDYWIIKLQGSPTTFDSANSGNWNATSTWICSCIPNGTLPVRIMSTHIITVPTTYTGQAKGLRFASTGKVTLQGTGKVNVIN